MADITASLTWHQLIVALIGGFLPAIVWLWFWLKEDKLRPEPRTMIWQTFVLGVIAVGPAFLAQNLIAEIFKLSSNDILSLAGFDSSIGILVLLVIITWATVEEILKYLAAYLSAFKSVHLDEPIDIMIYLLTAAIGFAAMENFLYVLNSLISETGSYFLLTGNVRFISSTVVHIVCSGLAGAIIALTYYSSVKIKKVATVLGLILASVLHALFNLFIIITEGSVHGPFIVFLCLWISAVGLIILFEKVKKLSI